jgi:hypothetical protein
VRRDREIDLLPSKVVGRRREARATHQTADTLLRTAWALRGDVGLARRGLYRFETFEEAREWMRAEASRRSGRRRSKMSAAVAERSRRPRPAPS